jgi:acylphosphatase
MTTPERSTLVRRILVEGVVQGVGYREFTRRAALRLNVSGWVRNRSDGAVEALVRGPPASVEALIAEMRQGPRFAARTEIERDQARRDAKRRRRDVRRPLDGVARSAGSPGLALCRALRLRPIRAADRGRRRVGGRIARWKRLFDLLVEFLLGRSAPPAQRLLRLVLHVGRSVDDMRRDAAARVHISPAASQCEAAAEEAAALGSIKQINSVSEDFSKPNPNLSKSSKA